MRETVEFQLGEALRLGQESPHALSLGADVDLRLRHDIEKTLCLFRNCAAPPLSYSSKVAQWVLLRDLRPALQDTHTGPSHDHRANGSPAGTSSADRGYAAMASVAQRK